MRKQRLCVGGRQPCGAPRRTGGRACSWPVAAALAGVAALLLALFPYNTPWGRLAAAPPAPAPLPPSDAGFAVRGPVPRVPWDSSVPPGEFLRRVAAGRATVVLTGSPVAQWPALQRWTDAEYVRQHVPHLTQVYRLRTGCFVYNESTKPRAGLRDGREIVPRMATRDFLQHVLNASADSPVQYYYSSRLARNDWEPLRGDLGDLTPFQLASLDTSFDPDEHTQLWIGHPHVCTHAHYDVYSNFYLQLVGRKQFRLGRKWMIGELEEIEHGRNRN